MVYKCIVPGCRAYQTVSNHQMPKEIRLANSWLRAVSREDLIGTQDFGKLRVCSVHFPDSMVIPGGQRRRLKVNAYPTLYLPHTNAIDSNCAVAENIDVACASTEGANLSDTSPIRRESKLMIITRKIVQPARHQEMLRKLRKCKKTIYREKRNNRFLKKRITRLKEEEKSLWKKTTEDFPTAKKIFMEMIYKNFKKDSQVIFKKESNKEEKDLTSMQKKKLIEATEKLPTILVQESNDGHRYDLKEKALALILYKSMGKRAYTCLRGIFQEIPSIQSLRNILNSIPFVPGINDVVLKHLRTRSDKMLTSDKACILMWDEVSIQTNLAYDIQKDIICGFEDWGNHRTNKLADHALVFMLRGLHSGWKLPVSFNFCTGTTNTSQLMRCIKEHILAINNAGFHVLATVCDQGANNMSAIKGLLQRTRINKDKEGRRQGQTFEVGGKEIIPLYDPPHLLKGVRNNLLTKDLLMDVGGSKKVAASWQIIKTAWAMDRKLNTIRPLLKNITPEHIDGNKIPKMRVKYAAQVLSGTVASCIETFSRLKCKINKDNEELHIHEEQGLSTAETINFFNNLFDSFNGMDLKENEMRSPVTEDSAHHEFWSDAKRKIRSMSYFDQVCKKSKSVPTLRNWQFTLDGIQKLWKTVHNEPFNFTFLRTRYCNQDTLKNFFGQIRAHSFRNNNPTPRQFQESFIALLVSNMKAVKIIGGNCEIIENEVTLFSLDFPPTNLSECNENECNRVENDEYSDEECEEVIFHQGFMSQYMDEIKREISRKLAYCEDCTDSLHKNDFSMFLKRVVYRIKKLLATRAYFRNISKVLLHHFRQWNIQLKWGNCREHEAIIFETVLHVIIVKIIIYWCKNM